VLETGLRSVAVDALSIVHEDSGVEDSEDPPEIFELVALSELRVEKNYEMSRMTALWSDGTSTGVYLGDCLESSHSCREVAR
jgi:hypothetical protein